ncbi:DMT family transporter [Halalkalibacter oceani]|uniref:DMT family transporter n=1 Tax=Halalkalibacter oceani TaxID=1653776 RepID=UPI00346CD9F2
MMKGSLEWLMVVVASVFEVGWVIGLKYAATTGEWALTAVAIIVSFGLLIRAGQRLPVGTVYAVFVGLGTAGTVTMDILIFGEPLRLSVLLFLALLLAGIFGLKAATSTEEVEKEGN